MTSLLAIDPGANTGWAYYYDGVLREVGCCTVDDKLALPPVRILVIEIPQVYNFKTSKVDPNDLITLAVTAGIWIERTKAERTIRVLPHQWKGSMPKDVHHSRLVKEATKAEYEILFNATKTMAKTKAHNVWDAYGLGKWAVVKI